MVRRVGSGVIAVAAGLALVAATMWWWDVSGPVPILQALYPAVAVGAVLILILGVVVRHRPAIVAASLAVVVAAMAVVPTVLPASAGHREAAGAAPGASGARVTVFAVNTQFGQADVTRIREVVTARSVDVLILTEAHSSFTPYAIESVADVLPHSSGATLDGAAGTLILSRFPMTVLDRDDADVTKHQQPIVRLDVAGGPVLVRGVHPRSPTSEDKLAAWRPDLLGIGDWQRGTTGPLVVAGDFNAAWPHPAFRSAADGLDDALRVTGQAWRPTWPVSSRAPAFTQIDHVLSRGFEVRAAGTERVPGTDHLGVWAELRLR